MQKDELAQLLNRYKAGLATDEEKAWLETWYYKNQQEEALSYSVTELQDDADQVWMTLAHQANKSKRTRI